MRVEEPRTILLYMGNLLDFVVHRHQHQFATTWKMSDAQIFIKIISSFYLLSVQQNPFQIHIKYFREGLINVFQTPRFIQM